MTDAAAAASSSSSQSVFRDFPSPMPPCLHQNTLLRLRLPPQHPLLFLFHSYSTYDRPPPPPGYPPPPETAELWIAKALAVVAFLRPHHLPAFRSLAPSPLAAAAALRHTPCASSALQLFATLHSSELSISPSPHSFRYAISWLCQSSRHADALQLFDRMTDQFGYFPSARFLSFLAGSCADANLIDAAASLLSKASQFGCCIETHSYNKLMSLFISRGRVQDALALFQGWLQGRVYYPDVWSFNVVIKGLCHADDVQKALELVERMDEFGCSPDIVTHNILVDGLCRLKEVSRGREVLRRLQRDGICIPNVVTYTTVISGYCKAGRMKDALAVYDDMVACGITPSRVTYNVLINGYGKAGNMGPAVSVYQQMILRCCSPDVVTFSSLIDGYCRCGQLDDAMRTWNEMAQHHIQPNAHTFCIVIHSFCKQNRTGEALRLLNELNKRADIAPQAFICNPVIDVLCKTGKVDEANLILMDMEGKGCHPDRYTYTILIIGHCMKGRISGAIAFFHKMVEAGCSPNSITVNSFIICLLKARMTSDVDRIMHIASMSASSSQKVPSPVSQSLEISVDV